MVEEGNISFAKRDYLHSIAVWKKALKLRPADVNILKKVAQAYLRLAEYSKAEKIFTQILKNKPDAYDVLLEFTKLLLVTGNITKATQNLDILKNKHPADPQINILYGDLLVIENRMSEAEDYYKKAIGTSVKNELVLIKLASCYLAQGVPDMAQQPFNIATAHQTESIDSLLQIANYWKLKNDMKKAESSIQKAIQLEPENLSLLMILSRFYFNSKQYQNAHDIIKILIIKAPENESVKKYLIKILLAQNQLNEIPALLERYNLEMKNDPEFNLLAGKYYLFMNNPLIANEHFKRVIREKPEHFLAHYFLGITYLLGEHIHLARQSFIKSLALNNSFSDAEIALANIYYKKMSLNSALNTSNEYLNRNRKATGLI